MGFAANVKIGYRGQDGICLVLQKTDLTFDLGPEKEDFGRGLLLCLGAALRRMLLPYWAFDEWRTDRLVHLLVAAKRWRIGRILMR